MNNSKNVVLSSHQPNFLPYLGLFYKAFKCDIFVFSDDVKFTKKGMHNYNYIKTSEGKKRLTIPVHSHSDVALDDILVCEPEYCIPKLVKTLYQEYRKSSMYIQCSDFMDLINSFSNSAELKMTDFNKSLTLYLFEKFGINPEIFSAKNDLHISGHKDERMFQMLERTGANIYYSGTGAKAYHNDAEYTKREISLVYTDYEPVMYSQMYEPFEENLSVVDYIFNNGYSLPEGWYK